ncbi:efflux RND transporter periplasmic adaptor subunit, partial [Rhodoplanes roseus]|uniref:efflux RND transporter periplasmic adaptor subunit n=1 Tax=Rhodoplanes roseus TaxID=29409 RepID=UPI000DABD44C
VGLAAAGAVWAFLPGGPAAPAAPQATAAAPAPPPAAATTVGQAPPAPAARTRPSGLAASGYVVARRKATVAAEITGKVIEVLVEEGMVVEAGQPVARIDSTLAETDFALATSKVEAADAAVTAISADLRDAERIHERTKSLSQKSFATEADLTRTEARVNVLRAQLAQAKAQLGAAKLDARRSGEVLDKHTVKAPFSGVVVDRSAQPGEMISPMSAGGSFTRTGICTIVDMGSIEVEVDVNEAFIGRVQKGGAVNAVLDAYPDWSIPSYVIAIVPTANREKATVRVRVGFRQKDPRILPDMAVKVTFVEDEAATAAASERTSAAR